MQFLHYLLRAHPEAPLLVVATARREELDRGHPLHDLLTGLRALERVVEVEVGRLAREEAAALAERLLRHPLGGAEVDRLFAETEGSPLFVVEALRAGWSGQDEPAPMTPRVQAVIESRLAQLSGPARDLVGVAATIGREFSTDVLAEASQTGEAALVDGLDELWRRRLIRDQGPDAYDFTHDRVREVAYLGLSPARRRHAHALVARALKRLHASDPSPVAAQLAAHHERAGAVQEAMDWYERAAAAAQRLPAYAEAARLLERALALLRSTATASLAQGDFEGARRVGERLRATGASEGDDVRAVQGEYVLGIAAFWAGEFEAARRHFEAAVDRYRLGRRSDRLIHYGATTEVLCRSRLGNTLGFLGHLDAAVQARAAALDRAAESGHAHSREAALVFGAMLALELRDLPAVRACTAELATRPGDLALPMRVVADALAGYVEVLDGRGTVGVARIRHALEDPAEAEHAPGMHAMIARVLLEACVATGDAPTALAAADRLLGRDDKVRTWESEGRRRRGELLAVLGAPGGDAEAELQRALEVARSQGAKLLELRAAASLLRRRLATDDDRSLHQARELLGAVVEAIPEGRDAPDLREALALLARS
jgi:tetratricopeptide (TPR) repeat protein